MSFALMSSLVKLAGNGQSAQSVVPISRISKQNLLANIDGDASEKGLPER